MDFTNEELVYIYSRIKDHKEKIEEAMKRKFIVTITKNVDGNGAAIGAAAKPLTDGDVSIIENGIIYNTCNKLVKKLDPIVEVILDADKDVQRDMAHLI